MFFDWYLGICKVVRSCSLHAHGLQYFAVIFLNEKLNKPEPTTKVCLQNVNQTTNDNLPFGQLVGPNSYMNNVIFYKKKLKNKKMRSAQIARAFAARHFEK